MISSTPHAVGDPLPKITRLITQERVNAYANAAKDFNPIHLDAEFAARTQFGGRIVHGMLSLAIVTESLAIAFPSTWHRTGRLKARFKAPVFPGETVTVSGEVVSVSEGPEGYMAECRLSLHRPGGEEAVAAQAWALIEQP